MCPIMFSDLFRFIGKRHPGTFRTHAHRHIHTSEAHGDARTRHTRALTQRVTLNKKKLKMKKKQKIGNKCMILTVWSHPRKHKTGRGVLI